MLMAALWFRRGDPWAWSGFWVFPVLFRSHRTVEDDPHRPLARSRRMLTPRLIPPRVGAHLTDSHLCLRTTSISRRIARATLPRSPRSFSTSL
jgi:hypothetical protein